jgi:hypothetical protein
MELDALQLEQSVYVSSKTPAPFVRLKEFSIRTNGSWGVFGLLTLKKPELASILKEEIARQQGDAVINLTIRTQTTFGDALIGIVSVLGLIYQPRSVFVTGTVVSFTKESSMLPLRSADLVAVQQSGGECFRIDGVDGIVNSETAFSVNSSGRRTP